MFDKLENKCFLAPSMGATIYGFDIIHDLIDQWLQDRELRSLWSDFQSAPNDETLGNLLEALRNIIRDRPPGPLLTFINKIWNEELRPTVVLRASAEHPVPPVYYRYLYASAGFRYVLPAPPDIEETSYRAGALRTVLEYLDRGDIRVIVATGHDTEEMRTFVTSELLSFFDAERIPHHYFEDPAGNKGKGLEELLAGAPPRILMLDWSAQMAKDERLTRLLERKFFTRTDRRLILLYQEGSALPNYFKANKAAPFLDRLSDTVQQEFVPVVGTLPQYMNFWQAAEYLFGRTTEATLGMARLISTYLPLLPPILKPVRDKVRIGKVTSVEKYIIRAAEELTSGRGSLIVTEGRLRQGAVEPDSVLSSRQGYETFYVRTQFQSSAAIPLGGSILVNPQLVYGAFMNRALPMTITPLMPVL